MTAAFRDLKQLIARPLGNRVVVLCALINILDGFDVMSMAYVAPSLAAEWSLGPLDLSKLFGAGLVATVLGSIFLSPLADRFGRRPLILLGLGLSILGMAASALAPDMTTLIIARFVTGLAVGLLLPTINTLVAEAVPREERSLSVAFMQAGFGVGAGVGGLLSVGLLGLWGWPAVFLLGAVASVIVAIAVAMKMPESAAYGVQAASTQESAAAKGRLRDIAVPIGLAGVAFFCCLLSFYFISNWTPKLLVDGGMGDAAAVTAGALLAIGGVLAAIAIGYLSMRRNLLPVVALFCVAAALLMIVMGQGGASSALILPVTFLLGIVIAGVQIGMYTVFPSLFPPAQRAGATGIAIGFGRLGSVVSPVLAGFLLEQGGQNGLLFGLMAIPYLLVALTLGLFPRFMRH